MVALRLLSRIPNELFAHLPPEYRAIRDEVEGIDEPSSSSVLAKDWNYSCSGDRLCYWIAQTQMLHLAAVVAGKLPEYFHSRVLASALIEATPAVLLKLVPAKVLAILSP